MQLLWQITVVETLLNLAVFAVAVIAFGFIPFLTLRLGKRLPPNFNLHWLSDAAVGMLFGAATAVVLLLPVHLNGGASTGSQTILLALAGLIAGPVAGVVALSISVAAQFLIAAPDATIGGSGVPLTFAAVLAGILFRLVLGTEESETRVSYYHFPLLGGVCALLSLVALWLLQGWSAVAASGIPAIIAGVLSCTVLGTLLLHETRRDKAERDLRESKCRLAEARDAAERANRSKSAFLANMSHELRTPLNAILGFSEMIADEYLGPVGQEQYKDYAGDIHASGEHLLSLINDLLDVAKIEAGKMEIAPELLSPEKVLDHVRMMMTIRTREKKQTLKMKVLPGMPALYADERALKQILINLVTNAIKFTPEGGRITVSIGAARSGNGVEIACIDTGAGISPEKLDKIFTPFSQVDNRFNRQGGGTGLGLSLVRGLAELHGGRAWLESAPGEGCKAYVELPSRPENTAANRGTAAA